MRAGRAPSRPAPGKAGVDLFATSDTVYLVSQNQADFLDGLLWRSMDAGDTWESVDLPATKDGAYAAQSVYANDDGLIIVGAFDPDGFAFANSILRSTDHGENWAVIKEGIPALALAIRPIRALGDTLFCGTLMGLLRSDDSGLTWSVTEGAGGPPTPPQVRDIAIIGNDVYFTGIRTDIAAHVWRSSDLGETWETAEAGLPFNLIGFANSLFATDEQLLIGGRFLRLYASHDQGESWFRSG